MSRKSRRMVDIAYPPGTYIRKVVMDWDFEHKLASLDRERRNRNAKGKARQFN